MKLTEAAQLNTENLPKEAELTDFQAMGMTLLFMFPENHEDNAAAILLQS